MYVPADGRARAIQGVKEARMLGYGLIGTIVLIIVVVVLLRILGVL